MPSQELITTLILGEIILIETVFIIALSVYFVLKRKKKSLKLKNLLESFLDDEKNRLSSLSLIFERPEFIDDEKYNTVLKNIINEENMLYKYLINAFYHNDIKSLDSLSLEIQNITRPCADLIFSEENKTSENSMEDNDPVINVDDAIDELLSDDEEIKSDIEHDPEFDLSEPTEMVTDPPEEELIETSVENDEIAEIPSDLLNDTLPTSENKISPEDISKNDEPDNGISDNKPEK
ncbi:MAG: hypothetical protein L3J84_09015 [Gammaproteobacteria bacterium]|nr:hypothetical protein [Gammaproteobacteria bacterium]